MNTEARELKLYAENESALYPQKQAIEKNLAIKAFKGVFDVKLAAKLWMYWLEAAAKRYTKEFDAPSAKWSNVFSKVTREQAALELAKDFEVEFKLGEFDKYKPKGLAKKATKRGSR